MRIFIMFIILAVEVEYNFISLRDHDFLGQVILYAMAVVGFCLAVYQDINELKKVQH